MPSRHPQRIAPTLAQSTTRSTTAAEPTRHSYIPALDALRGIAVLAVIAYHLEWPFSGGGFLGVDLFFVLSGFLITAILLHLPGGSDLRRHLAQFYLHRTRRLLPALTLLLLAVSAWAAFVALPEQLTGLRQQGLGTVFYVSNWVLMGEETAYVDIFTDPSPLQHTWTLAIEEQFYLVWPVLVLALLARRHRRLLMSSSLLIAIASAIAMWVTASSGALNEAYLGTFTRIHELMIGALAAQLLDSRRAATAYAGRHRASAQAGLHSALPTILIVTSAAIIAGGMATFSPQDELYYRGGSVVFSIAVAVLIVTLARHRPEGGALLGNRALRWIGVISYGLYLWHWPVIVWLTPATTGLGGVALDALRLATMFAVAALSFHLIERPLRRGGWRGLPISSRAWWWAVPASMAMTAACVVVATSSASADADEAMPAASVVAPDHLLGNASAGGRTLLIVGDSVPQEIMADLGAVAASANTRIIPLAFGGCSVIGRFQVDSGGAPFTWSRRCTEAVPLQQDALAQHAPDTVVWYSNRERYGIRLGDGEHVAAGTAEHRRVIEDAITESVERLTSTGARLIIVQPAPKAQATIGMCSREPESADCAASPEHLESMSWLRAAYSRMAEELPRVDLVTVDDVLCPSGPPCRIAEVDGTPIRPDGVHIARDLEPWFAGILLERILATGDRQW